MHPKIVALDIGSVRVGVAVSDGLRMLAHPLTTLKWQNEQMFIRELETLLTENSSDTLVVGIPYTMKGTESEQTKRVLKLIELIKQSLDIKIDMIDERLTTKMAENMLKDVNKKASRNRHIIDQLAAVNILQTYLDKTRI
jgi:putative holliday junction resolvase